MKLETIKVSDSVLCIISELYGEPLGLDVEEAVGHALLALCKLRYDEPGMIVMERMKVLGGFGEDRPSPGPEIIESGMEGYVTFNLEVY